MKKIKNATVYGVMGNPKKQELMHSVVTNAELIDDLMKHGYRCVPVGGNSTSPCTTDKISTSNMGK